MPERFGTKLRGNDGAPCAKWVGDQQRKPTAGRSRYLYRGRCLQVCAGGPCTGILAEEDVFFTQRAYLNKPLTYTNSSFFYNRICVFVCVEIFCVCALAAEPTIDFYIDTRGRDAEHRGRRSWDATTSLRHPRRRAGDDCYTGRTSPVLETTTGGSRGGVRIF